MSAQTKIPHGIERHAFDVIVVGGGINGAGIARDAAMRGLDVLLLDKHDIASGTTPWSTRLIHGGLRYLEHAEPGLVRESLRERETLLRTAPHLVQPLEFLLPIYEWHKRGPTTIRAGMIAYDLLSAGKRLPRHRMLSRAGTLTAAPGMASDGLRGAACYHDAQVTFPERLALENVLDAAAFGATIVTHAEVSNIVVRNGAVVGVDVRLTDDDTHVSLSATTVINAAGPWVDRLLEGLEPMPLIGGTKGSHIIVDRFPSAPVQAVYSEAQEDGRPFFIIPWLGRLLIGTTDVPFEGEPDGIRPSLEEVDYLIRQTQAVFPGEHFTREAVRIAYAGVRPLPVATGRSAGAITRRHFIRDHAPRASGVYSVIGGKLTTYRSLAEEVTDIASRRTGRRDRCETSSRVLPGFGDTASVKQRLRAFGVPPACVDRLASVYGTRTSGICDLIAGDPSLANPLGDDIRSIAAEVVFAVEHEFARTIADVLLRRTMLGLRPELGLDVLEPALKVAGQHLGWRTEQIDAERRGYMSEIERLRVPDAAAESQITPSAAYNPPYER